MGVAVLAKNQLFIPGIILFCVIDNITLLCVFLRVIYRCFANSSNFVSVVNVNPYLWENYSIIINFNLVTKLILANIN